MTTTQIRTRNQASDTVSRIATIEIPADYDIRSTSSTQEPRDTSTSVSEKRPGPCISSSISNNATTNPPSPNTEDVIDPTTEPHPRAPGAGPVNWWPTDWRRIPEHCPVNRELDFLNRPIGENAFFGVFLTITFTGCGLIAVSEACYHTFHYFKGAPLDGWP